MTSDTAYGTPHGAPIDYDWLRLYQRSPAAPAGPRLRLRPGVARVLRALGLITAVAAPAVHAAEPASARGDGSQAVVELRQYTLHPGRRDTLIEIFEQNFIESQEQAGMRVLGQFHDLDNPDRFVWLRGFAGMPQRKTALETFYGGPVWKAGREAANATMIDSDNVLLLRPAWPHTGFDLHGLQRPAAAAAADAAPAGLVAATIYYLKEPATPALLKFLRTWLEPQLAADGVRVLASFVSEAAENTFPALPVRLGEPVLVIFTAHAGADALAAVLNQREASADWREIAQRLQPYLRREAELLRLAPTRRSLLRGG
ncbi:NIPSNAP family protein [Tahibacter harae]|uniref:NIPSNAP family protein n=1 Tax=Tahibacter harae TaxID=2963937 RepID=A0ABT1QQU7_9GAMM|nr:NIPSNAP family protein [Tahibacter harae]MCQ4164670.1 NIPSNAP family protein [Tahibacter harae]